MNMSPEAAWRLVNALTDAARRHEAEVIHGTQEGYRSAVNDEARAEEALVAALLVAALTGLNRGWAAFHRPDILGCTPDSPPANLVSADEEREAERQAAFASATSYFELPADDDNTALVA